MGNRGRLTVLTQWTLAVVTDVGDQPALRPCRDQESWILTSRPVASHLVSLSCLGLSFLVCKNDSRGASLVAQWLRFCLLMQGTRVRALVWEDPTCCGANGPVSHNY